ncbi:hypothetical protein [Streptomyces sp. NPDC002758]
MDAASLAPHAQQPVGDVAALTKDFRHQDFDRNGLPLRTHEILENTLHQELTGAADHGSGTGRPPPRPTSQTPRNSPACWTR